MKQFKNPFILIPTLILFGIVSYYVFTTSSYVRFWADDFCSSVFLRNNGYWQSQILWWKSWTGRYSYIAFVDLVFMGGLAAMKILPSILFVSFLLPLVFLIGFVPSALFSVIFLLNSPNIIQTFYWTTGSLNYFAPFVFLNFYLLILFQPFVKYSSILSFVLLFVSTGFSEAFGVANLLFLVFLLFVLPKKNNKRLISIGLVATILSLGMMYLSPGNAVRSSLVSHPSSLLNLVVDTFKYSKWYLIHLLHIKSFVISVMVIISGAFIYLESGKKYFNNPKRVLFLSFTFIFLVTLTVVGLTYQAMNWEPPERVMSIVTNFIILATVIMSVSIFQLVHKLLPKMLPKLIFLISLIFLTYQLNYDWTKVKLEISDYAQKWDKVEQVLIDSKNSDEVKVPNIKMIGKLDGFTDNKGWIMGCIKAYYETGEIIVE